MPSAFIHLCAEYLTFRINVITVIILINLLAITQNQKGNMATVQAIKELKIVQIGNSKGIRLPKSIIDKYGFSDSLCVEIVEDGIFLRSKKSDKLSWDETFKAMKNEDENWDDLDITVNDGLEGDDIDS